MLYILSREFFRIWLKIFGRIKCAGGENVPATGGVILAPNHISYLDPPTVGMGTHRQVHYMAKEELFKGIMGKWMLRIGTFPVRRGTADRKAIKQAIELLNQGRVVCIFPEGTRSPDGKLQEPELGIGLIALKSRAPIVPAAITGTDRVLPPHGGKLRCHPVTIAYGKPLTFPEFYEGRETRDSMEEVGRRTMAAIADLQRSLAP